MFLQVTYENGMHDGWYTLALRKLSYMQLLPLFLLGSRKGLVNCLDLRFSLEKSNSSSLDGAR